MDAKQLQSMPVQEVMDQWPETVTVFVHRAMNCPGCAMAHLMTVAEAAASYDVCAEALSVDLLAIIGRADSGNPIA